MRSTTRTVLRRYAQAATDFAASTVLLMAGFLVMLLLWAGVEYLGVAVPRRPAMWTVAVVPIAATYAYEWWSQVWWPYRRGGATPGMRLFGLRVETVDGEPPRLRAYVIRFLLMVVDWALYGVVGALVIALNPEHQRFGDIVARTRVVHRPAAPSSADLAALPGPDGDLGAVADAELTLHRGEMGLDR
jgi:uncharacterized RDD family membrane protein YckC